MHKLLLILPFFCLFLQIIFAQTSKYDSLKNEATLLNGKEKLEYYARICMETAAENDVPNQFRFFEDYRLEANRQGDADHEVNARTQRLYAFYNYGMTDSLYKHLEEDLDFMIKHKQWLQYYSCSSLRVERLLYDKKIHMALAESKKIYAYAKEHRHENGLGISAYLLASSYQSMGRHKEACDFFIEAEKHLRKDLNEGQLHNVYGMAWQSLSAVGNYDIQLEMGDRWEKMWNSYCEEKDLAPEVLAPYMIVCHLSRAHAYLKKEDLKSARKYLDKAEVCALGLRDISLLSLYKEEALYEELMGNYSKSLEYIDRRQTILDSLDNRLTSIENNELRARILIKLGRGAEAAFLYEQLLPKKDSINSIVLSAQLDELNSIYQVDHYRLESATNRQKYIIAIGGCSMLLLLIVFLIYHNHTVKRKNVALISRIRKQEAAEAQLKVSTLKQPIEELSLDQQLFRQIEKLFEDKEIFMLPKLGREELAQMIGSNRTYVGNAIRNCTEDECSVSEYVNRKRVGFALRLLEHTPTVSIEEVGERCGFRARSAFYRAFRSRYDMAPSDFRKLAISNKKVKQGLS